MIGEKIDGVSQNFFWVDGFLIEGALISHKPNMSHNGDCQRMKWLKKRAVSLLPQKGLKKSIASTTSPSNAPRIIVSPPLTSLDFPETWTLPSTHSSSHPKFHPGVVDI